MTTSEKEAFRQISSKDYENLDEGTKRTLMHTQHMGILRSSEMAIYQALKVVLESSQGFVLEDLVAVCMHVDEEIAPDELRNAALRNNPPSEVCVFISSRNELAENILKFKVKVRSKSKVNGKRGFSLKSPYAPAARALRTPPPQGHLYMAVFANGMCTIGCFGFSLETALPPPEVVQSLPESPTEVAPAPEVVT
jgi:hypothetical protein